jgi:hypothetical protein
MSTNETPNAGSETDQHITGSDETGTFQTDKAPSTNTPTGGSSNIGINKTQANRVEPEPENRTA